MLRLFGAADDKFTRVDAMGSKSKFINNADIV